MNKAMKSVVLGIVTIFIIVVGLFNGIYVLDDGEQAIIERFGEKISIEKSAGIKLKIPFIDKVNKLKTDNVYTLQYGYRSQKHGDTQTATQYADVPTEAIILTNGSYIVNVEAMVQYRIIDAEAFYYNVDDPEGTLRLAFEGVLRRNVQNKDIDEALRNKAVISSETKQDLQKKINDYGLGLRIESLEIQNTTLPAAVKPSYDDVINARNEKDKLLDDAKKYRNEKLPSARAKAYKMIEEAKGYKADKVKSAQGDVARFNEVYEKYKLAKDVTRTRLKIETMEEVLKSVKDIHIIDMDSNGTIKYLPLTPSSTKGKGAE